MKTYLFIAANKNKSSFFKQNYHQWYFWFKIHQPLLFLIIIRICNCCMVRSFFFFKLCITVEKNVLLDPINK